MKNTTGVRIWVCDCGRVHVETQFHRMSFLPVQFLDLLRNGTDKASAGSNFPRQSYLKEACETDTTSRAGLGQRRLSAS